MGEEASIGIHAESDKRNSGGQSEIRCSVGYLDGIDTCDLLIGFRCGSVEALGIDQLSVDKEVHAYGSADGSLGAAGYGYADEEREWSVVVRKHDVDAKPGEGAATGMGWMPGIIWSVILRRAFVVVLGGGIIDFGESF